MKLKTKNKSLITFSILSVAFIIVMMYFLLTVIVDGVINQELSEMKTTLTERHLRIETLHARATEDIVFALKNPAFAEYFDLPDTKAGNVYNKNGTLQFTEPQRVLKAELEQWIWHFQNKFQVDETCIIDTTGQEHARLVLQRIEKDELLSPDEKQSPFFEESFQKGADEVHIEYPYVSPDTNRWVFAYTSPVIIGTDKPAIYHFEMPITVFQDMVNTSHGRIYVVDPQGYIIADSSYNYSTNTINSFEEHFPQSTSIISDSTLQEINNNTHGNVSYQSNGEKYHLVYQKLSMFDWILVYEEPEILMLTENNTPFGNMTNTLIMIIVMGSMMGAQIITLLLINRITTGLQVLSDAQK